MKIIKVGKHLEVRNDNGELIMKAGKSIRIYDNKRRLRVKIGVD
nr:MAG TPA: hypothetical protein [Caudoviricetes sp.]DAX98302.1 MAG TPA: hypothetical protein [Caudoviricetes sp.]